MKKMKDSCFNEFDPNAMSVEAALESILKNFNGLTKKYDEKEFLEYKNEILSSLLNQSFLFSHELFYSIQ